MGWGSEIGCLGSLWINNGGGYIYICEDSPTNADVDWRPFIARRKEAIPTVIRTHDSGTVHVREDGMVEPHSTNANPRCQLLALKSKPSGTSKVTYVSALASLPSSYVRPACIQVTKQSVQGT